MKFIIMHIIIACAEEVKEAEKRDDNMSLLMKAGIAVFAIAVIAIFIGALLKTPKVEPEVETVNLDKLLFWVKEPKKTVEDIVIERMFADLRILRVMGKNLVRVASELPQKVQNRSDMLKVVQMVHLYFETEQLASSIESNLQKLDLESSVYHYALAVVTDTKEQLKCFDPILGAMNASTYPTLDFSKVEFITTNVDQFLMKNAGLVGADKLNMNLPFNGKTLKMPLAVEAGLHRAQSF